MWLRAVGLKVDGLDRFQLGLEGGWCGLEEDGNWVCGLKKEWAQNLN